MIPSRVTRVPVDIQIPWMLMQSTLSLVWQGEKGHQVRAMGVLSAVVHIFNEIAMHAKAQASNRMAKANSASHGPRVSPHNQAKVRVRKTRDKSKENPKEPKVRTKVPKAGVMMNGMTIGVLLDGTKVGNKRTTLQKAHFQLRSFDLGAMTSPKQFEWVKMNLDTGAAVNTPPIELWPRKSRRWKILSDCQW